MALVADLLSGYRVVPYTAKAAGIHRCGVSRRKTISL